MSGQAAVPNWCQVILFFIAIVIAVRCSHALPAMGSTIMPECVAGGEEGRAKGVDGVGTGGVSGQAAAPSVRSSCSSLPR